MNEPEKIKELLKKAKTVAVVGLSPKTHRASNHVAQYLQEHGYSIIPVYPREEKILGEKVYRNLKDISVKVDIVCIFRNPKEVIPVIDDAIRIKPLAVWMQEGVVNSEAAKKAENAGVFVVMDRCMFKEHNRI